MFYSQEQIRQDYDPSGRSEDCHVCHHQRYRRYSDKFDITKHKRYKELADYDKKNTFDVEKYLEHKLVLTENVEFEVFDC